MGYLEYVRDVLSGKQVAGEFIRLACERFMADLQRQDLVFKKDIADRAISFIAIIKHYTGKHAGNPFLLQPWQQFIVANIVGWYWKETNTRRYTSSYIEVSRKNGKTALAAALCLYFLIADGEGGAEVLLAANSKEQAKIAFDMCSKFSKGLDPKKKYIQPFRADILFNATDSKLKVLAADDSTLDGFNASFGLLDEYHSAKNSKVRDVIKSSMGMRENPHLCTITTAGFDKSGPCYQLRSVCVEILYGVKMDDETFIAIYCLDDGDDWTDESNWIKCTPNLGVTVTWQKMRTFKTQAMNNPSEEVPTLTKNFNVWCDSAETWIASNIIVKSTRNFTWDNLINEDSFFYCGVDLASVSDFTAYSALLVKDGIYYFRTKYYLPEDTLTSGNENKELYKQWAREGYLTITPGNVTDYDMILKDIKEDNHIAPIFAIGYDKWNATQWAIDAISEGLPLEEFSQTLGNFNMPTKELERLLLSGKVILDNNPITRFCFKNVRLKQDHNGNAKPDKSSNKNKIDGVISIIEALGMYLNNPQYGAEITNI